MSKIATNELNKLVTKITNCMIHKSKKIRKWLRRIESHLDAAFDKLCPILFEHLDNLYARYMIRKIFVAAHNLALKIIIQLEKILESQYDTIEFLLINRQEKGDLYTDIYSIQRENMIILEQIGKVYHNFPITKTMRNTIYLCGDMIDLELLFVTNESFWEIILKHAIYINCAHFSSGIFSKGDRIIIQKILRLIDEPYCVSDMLHHIREINDIRVKLNYIRHPNPTPYEAAHLHECLLSLLKNNYDITDIIRQNNHLYSIKFFEQVYDRLFKTDPHHPVKSYKIIQFNYSIISRALAKKCLTKHMEKYGKYESPDNLNDRHLIDLIMTFVI